MNLIFKMNKRPMFSKHMSYLIPSKNHLIFSVQCKSFSRTKKGFESSKSGEPNRSQRGIFQGKADRWGFMKSHSMRQY